MPARRQLIQQHEGSPELGTVERTTFAGAEMPLGVVESVTLRLALQQVVVEGGHKDLRGLIRHLPQAHHDGLHTRLLETALQPEHTLTLVDVAVARLAGGEHHEVYATEIHPRDFLRRVGFEILNGGGKKYWQSAGTAPSPPFTLYSLQSDNAKTLLFGHSIKNHYFCSNQQFEIP